MSQGADFVQVNKLNNSNLANYSFRKADSNNLVLLGETEEYEPLSRGAYFRAMRDNMEVNDPEQISEE